MFPPSFHVSFRVYRLLEEISGLRERIRASLVRLPWVPSLVKEAMARSAWGSTAIEGCTLSLEAVRGLLEGKRPAGYPDRHVRMARNYLDALAWLQKRPAKGEIRERDLFELHRIVGEGTVDEGPVGAYRRADVRAGLHVCPPWREVPRLTRELLTWLNGPAEELPAVFSSALFHLRFVEIHPFRDGNGRIGRALGAWQLYRSGFDTQHIFSLDEVLLENRALYIRALVRVQVAREDAGGWLEFMSEAVLETLERVEARIAALGPLKDRPISLTIRQEKLLRILRERGPLGIQDIARALRVTSPGAHYALRPLIQGKVIEVLGRNRSTRYTLR